MTSADANVRTELPMSKVQVFNAERTAGSGTGPRRATSFVLVGALLGLAWSSGLRGFMAQVAGNESTVGWTLTFLWVLLPGVLIGGLLGWAEHRRRVGRRRRWLALSPLLFSAILFSRPWDILSVFEDGIGGGALGVPLFGIVGGYALAGRLTWVRVLCGMVAASTIPIWALTVTSFAPHLAVDSPRGAWAALYYYSFMATLMLACAIPLRASPVARDHRQSMEGETDLSVPVGLPARPLPAKTTRSSPA
jgi:hypothetical protein